MSQSSSLVRGWSIEGYRRFWAAPDRSLLPAVSALCADDIVGHWPKPLGRVVGRTPYVGFIEALIAACPDLSLTADEYACAGDLHFVRWVATGAGPDGRRFEIDGIDRVKTLPDGRVAENYICSDGELFAWAAAHLAA